MSLLRRQSDHLHSTSHWLTLLSLKVQKIYSKLPNENIVKAIRSYGSNMRTLALVLSNDAENVDKRISTTADQLVTSKLKRIISSNVSAVGDASRSIVTTVCPKRPQPNEETAYRLSDAPEQIVASPTVMNALLRAHGTAVYVDLIHLVETFSKIPAARASAGWVWEHWANAQIRKGGNFILNPITFEQPTKATRQSNPTTTISDTTQPFSIHIPRMDIRCFDAKEAHSVTIDDKYFIPASKNNATFDAFFHTEHYGIGLQMTLSDTHSLNADGLKKLHDRLEARRQTNTQHLFIVVVRKGHRFKNFTPTPTPKQQQQFRFLTMQLELPAGMCLFLPSTCATADNDDS